MGENSNTIGSVRNKSNDVICKGIVGVLIQSFSVRHFPPISLIDAMIKTKLLRLRLRVGSHLRRVRFEIIARKLIQGVSNDSNY